MADIFHIKGREEIIQIDGKVYKIPEEVNFVEDFKDSPDVSKRTIELAVSYGTNFLGFQDGINCMECSHTGLFDQAMKGITINKGGAPDPNCKYKGNVDQIHVFSRKEKGLFGKRYTFMARDSPCTVKDAFHRALQEFGHLDVYLLESIGPKSFHYIREFKHGSELGKQASKEYKRLSK